MLKMIVADIRKLDMRKAQNRRSSSATKQNIGQQQEHAECGNVEVLSVLIIAIRYGLKHGICRAKNFFFDFLIFLGLLVIEMRDIGIGSV